MGRRWTIQTEDGRTVQHTDSPTQRDRFRRKPGFQVHRQPTSPPQPSEANDKPPDEWTPPRTSDGTPCTRCQDQDEPCWQHAGGDAA